MVGLGRLDDLQACVESVVADGVEGDLIEAGAWRGGASLLMRATLDTLGDDAHGLGGRLVPGLPAPDERDEAGAPRSARSTSSPRRSRRCATASRGSASSAASRSCRASSRRRCRRSPAGAGRSSGSTPTPTSRPALALDCLYPGLAPGGYLIVDDYGSFAGLPPGGRRVPRRARDRRAARARSTATVRALAPRERGRRSSRRDRRAGRRRAARPARAPRGRHVPTAREVALARELADAARAARGGRGAIGLARAPGAAAGVAAAEAGRAMIVFGSLDHRPRRLPALRGARHPARRRAGLGGARQRRRRLDLPLLQPDPRHGRRARRPRGARARPPGRRDRRPRLLREAAARRSRDPDVGVVGCVGAIGVRSIAWWEGSVTWASFTHRYGELGGGELPGVLVERRASCRPTRAPARSTRSTASCSALSPWAVRNVRFDESLGQLHGYDFDFCLQVRAAGRKVVTADFQVVHHHSLELVSDPETWIAGAHAGRGEVGRPDARASASAAATGSSARGAPRPRRRPRARRSSRRSCRREARERAARARARGDRPRASAGGSPSRCAGSTLLRRQAGPARPGER